MPPSDYVWRCTLPAGHECDHVAGEVGNVLCWRDDGTTINPLTITVVRRAVEGEQTSAMRTMREAEIRESLRSGFVYFGPSEVAYLLDELSAVRAELEEAKQDTARIDWIEQNSALVSVFDPPSGDAWVWEVVATDDDGPIGPPPSADSDLRAAIDAAMHDLPERKAATPAEAQLAETDSVSTPQSPMTGAEPTL